MNYTENYHLPQWDETDRIMRTDFNRMCTDMEAGLTGLEDGLAEEHSGREAGDAALRDRGFRNVCRLAYNHYLLVDAADRWQSQTGAFYQEPELKYLPNAAIRDGMYYIARSDETDDRDSFFGRAAIVSDMRIAEGDLAACTPGVVSFSTKTPTCITALPIDITYATVPAEIQTISLRLSLKNMGTGLVEWSRQLDCEVKNQKVDKRFQMGMSIPFHGGQNYQLILEPMQAAGTGHAYIYINPLSCGTNFYTNYPYLTLSRSFTDAVGGRGGIAVVRCRRSGTGGTVILNWNGREMQPAYEREVPVENWEPVREYVFVRDDDLPAQNDLSVTLTCNKEGEFWFYNWGAMLL